MLKCFPGTYRDSEGATSSDDCVNCPAGFFCETGLSAAPTGDDKKCDKGHYCPESIVLNPFLTEFDLLSDDVQGALNRRIGSFGPKQFPCPGGTYTDVIGTEKEADCIACPAYFYCPIGSFETISCPEGFYCGDNTEVPLPCPKGTFHDVGTPATLSLLSECTDCTEGFFCDGEGLTDPRKGRVIF